MAVTCLYPIHDYISTTLDFAPVVVGLALPDARSWHWQEGRDIAADGVLPADVGRKENEKSGRMLCTVICRNTPEGACKGFGWIAQPLCCLQQRLVTQTPWDQQYLHS